jgi:gamma-glutamyltranspeptidase/glutathione hydrolase
MAPRNHEQTAFDPALPYPSQRAAVFGQQAVASSHGLATQAGVAVLERGGNAVDAALAAAAVLTVVEPTMNGLGGDLFALVWDGAELHGLNASGRAPRAWSLEHFAGRSAMPALGWDSVTVPGGVSGWSALSQRFGSLPFSDLLARAIGYARDGFAVTPRIAALWAEGGERFRDFAEFQRVFLPLGRAPLAGQWCTLPDAADTLAEIAATGGESFYRGAIAERITEAARADGALLSLEDLAEQRAAWVEPLATDYAGVRLHELPPNGQGLASLLTLAVLSELELDRHGPDDADGIHLQIEAMKLAFAQCELHLGDPAAMSVSPSELLDPRAVRALAGRIQLQRAAPPRPMPRADQGTVYVAVGDAAGRMVSLIQSNYLGFGSGVVVPRTGISLHNRGLGFRLEPGHPSCVAGGKRPYHTIMPGFVTRDQQAEMAFGVIGGHMQPQGHVQCVIRSFLYRQNPQAVCDAPRWHVTERCEVALEPGFPASVAHELGRRGHQLIDKPTELLFGGAQLVRRMPRGYCAGSDPRKDGQAAGV